MSGARGCAQAVIFSPPFLCPVHRWETVLRCCVLTQVAVMLPRHRRGKYLHEHAGRWETLGFPCCCHCLLASQQRALSLFRWVEHGTITGMKTRQRKWRSTTIKQGVPPWIYLRSLWLNKNAFRGVKYQTPDYSHKPSKSFLS